MVRTLLALLVVSSFFSFALVSGASSCEGCLVSAVCVPYQVRYQGQYCTGEGLYAQKVAGSLCDAGFECVSNSCSAGKCIDVLGEVAQQQKTTSFSIRALCGILSVFEKTSFEDCVAGYGMRGNVPQISACVDSDGGIVSGSVGTVREHLCPPGVTNMSLCQVDSYPDVCTDSVTVHEFFCSGNVTNSTTVSCPNGCVNGLCQMPLFASFLTSSASSSVGIFLHWDNLTGYEQGLVLYRSLSPTSGFTLIRTFLPVTYLYSDVGLIQNTTYYYYLTSHFIDGRVINSSIVNATTLPFVAPVSASGVPTPISVSAVPSGSGVLVTWGVHDEA